MQIQIKLICTCVQIHFVRATAVLWVVRAYSVCYVGTFKFSVALSAICIALISSAMSDVPMYIVFNVRLHHLRVYIRI